MKVTREDYVEFFKSKRVMPDACRVIAEKRKRIFLIQSEEKVSATSSPRKFDIKFVVNPSAV